MLKLWRIVQAEPVLMGKKDVKGQKDRKKESSQKSGSQGPADNFISKLLSVRQLRSQSGKLFNWK